MTLQEQLKELGQLDPNEVGSWPTLAYVVISILLFVGVLGGGFYYLIYDGLQKDLVQAENEETQLRQTLMDKQTRAANLEAYREQLEDMRRSLGGMLRQLPGEAEIDSLVIDISQAALAAGLDQELFQPEDEVVREFYAEKPIRMILSGDYHRFGNFVSAVAALPRIVTIHDVQLMPDSDRLTMSVTARTYRYLEADDE